MKTLVTVILILACVGLVITLVVNQQHIDEQRKKDADAILDFSNQVVAANDELNDLRQVNLELTNDLNSSRNQIVDLSNQMLTMSDTISNRDSQIKTAEDQIAALQAQNQSLDQQAAELTNTITDLTAKIEAAEQQLAQSSTNNIFLQSELTNRLQELAVLNQKFNDLKTVRQQAKKLHNELVVQRRIEWIREGTQPNNNVKGGQLLMARSWPTNRLAPPTHYNMAVEVDSSGAVHIVSETNNAAATNSSQ
jgi:chromosome segregation ATPase